MTRPSTQSGRRIRVRGQVQGVGFRPFIWRLAREMGLSGSVCNDSEGVLIDAFGDGLDRFETRILTEAPAIARVSTVEATPIPHAKREGFEIIRSRGGIAATRVTPDLATCPDCLAEISSPGEKRYRYPFTNCTNCGPRFSIVHTLPYDRANTSMREFALCAHCQAQYENPEDRRFHAQPIACPECGPKIEYRDQRGFEAIKAAAKDLRAGKVLAIKGIGGFHLAVDASNEAAITRLRERKRRPAKPLALMGFEQAIAKYARIGQAARSALETSAAPIVLIEKSGHALPEILAPGQDRLGWMLPYSPLHHLLLTEFGGILVMSSGNISGEPQIVANDEAREKLAGIADHILTHNRVIERRMDDSVVQIFRGEPLMLRRARGFAPATIPLPPGFEDAPNVVGFGGHLKSTITLLKNGEALMSHHLGDLDNALAMGEFDRAFRDYCALFDHKPAIAAVDLHPEFHATRFGADLSARRDIPLIEVQHHHAHMAAVMAEHGLPLGADPVIGIVLDGLGLGAYGTIWGGEILAGDYCDYERVGWLRGSALIGGDLAQRETWRNALARLDDAGLGDLADELFGHLPINTLRGARKGGINSPLSTSAGRLFDAFAALIGIHQRAQSFEGEAAMKLEACAREAFGAKHSDTIPPNAVPADIKPYSFAIDKGVIDPAPMFHEWARMRQSEPQSLQAARFHKTIAQAFANSARKIAQERNIKTIILSGGVMQNLLLLRLLLEELQDFNLLYAKNFPANDGGISLGQAVIAAARAISLGYDPVR